MNKFTSIVYLAVVVAMVAVVAEANLFSKKDSTPEPIDVDSFGASDVIQSGIPNYAALRDQPCSKNKNKPECNDCCVSKGYTKGYFPKRMERMFARGLVSLLSKCTCVNEAINDE